MADYHGDRRRYQWPLEYLAVAVHIFFKNSSSEMNAINDDRATVVIAGFDSHLQMSYVAGLMENTENPISY